MGLFDRLLYNDYIVAAKRLLERTLEQDVTDVDREMAATLSVSLKRFIEERTYLRIAAVRGGLYVFGRRTPRETLALADSKFDEMLRAHFEKLTGQEGGGPSHYKARNRYIIEEPAAVAAKFHFFASDEIGEQLTGDSLMGFVEWTHRELKTYLVIVGEQTKGLR